MAAGAPISRANFQRKRKQSKRKKVETTSRREYVVDFPKIPTCLEYMKFPSQVKGIRLALMLIFSVS